MKILGIDPGLNITGYGLIEIKDNRPILIEAGLIKTSFNNSIIERLAKIYNGLSQLIHQTKPNSIVLEKLYTHYRHPTTACLLGHVRGVICLLAAEKHLKFFEYGATRIRKSILGRGNASKYQIQRMMSHIFNLNIRSLQADASDALALAVAHANITRMRL